MRNSPLRLRYPRGAWLWGTACAFIVFGAAALWLVPAALLEHWVPDGDAEEKRRLLGTAAQIVLFALGGIIAVIGVALSLARHGQELQASARDGSRHALEVQKETSRRSEFERQRSFEADREERRIAEAERQRQADQDRELRSRFVSAVDLLSTEAPIKRTAGLYALGAVADDWSAVGRDDEVQVCIDVLCGYLRSAAPLDPADQETESSVRRTGFALIRTHLRPKETRTPWTGHRFDLSAVPVWFDLDLSSIECVQGTRIILDGMELTHRDASLNLDWAQVRENSMLTLRNVTIADGGLALISEVTVQGRSALEIDNLRIGVKAAIRLSGSKILDSSHLNLSHLSAGEHAKVLGEFIEVADSTVFGRQMTLAPGAVLYLGGMNIRDNGNLDLSYAQVAPGAKIDLQHVAVESGTVHLNRSKLHKDASIDLDHAQFIPELSLDLSEMGVDDGMIAASGAVFNHNSLILPSERVETGSDLAQTPGIVVEHDGLTIRAAYAEPPSSTNAAEPDPR